MGGQSKESSSRAMGKEHVKMLLKVVDLLEALAFSRLAMPKMLAKHLISLLILISLMYFRRFLKVSSCAATRKASA